VVAIFCNRLLKNEALTIFGDGEQTRDYVFVRDVVAANMLASKLDMPTAAGLDTRAFNVGTGVGTSVIGLASALEKVAHRAPGRDHKPERPGELRQSTLDASLIRSRGWAPAFTLEQGLKETYDHIAAQGAKPSA
jgi:UDP-glucose 4-epimerase